MGILFTVLANAQSNVHWGLKGGVNISAVNISGGGDYNSKAGFHAGGLAHIHLSKTWALQPELMYSTQGGKDGSTKLNLDYINIPLQVQYMFNNGFRLQTGPQLGLLTNARIKTGDVKVDVKDGLTNADFSWTFGTSYLTKSGLGVDLRYNAGLTDIDKATNVSYKNSVFQLGLFYQFMHSKK